MVLTFGKGAEFMARAGKKKQVKAGFFTKLLIFILITALGWQLYRLHDQVQTAEAQKTQLSAQVEEQQQKNDSLQKSINNGGSKEEMEQIARDELGLVSPGERVFYDVSN